MKKGYAEALGAATRVQGTYRPVERYGRTVSTLAKVIKEGVKHCYLFKHDTPSSVKKWLKRVHNNYHGGKK